VALKTGIVDMRAERYAVHIHIVTAADIADCFDGGISDTVLLSVNGQEPQKVARKAAVGELADLAKAKAVYMNYRYMTPEEAAKVTADSVMNGLVTVLTGSDCVVADCEKRLLADRAQSCGKCVFCREGLIQLGYMQKEITQGRGKPEYLDLSREIGEAMCVSDLCSLGQETAKKALSGMETFAAEYGEHIRKKNCPAGVCMSKEHYYIDPKLCTGCGDCEDVCPADSIEGRPQYIYMIDDLGCTRCGKCIEACGEQAIQKTAGRLPKLPDRLTRVGRFHAR
jgi:ferredoxin